MDNVSSLSKEKDAKQTRCSFHIVVLGRFGSFRVVSNGWDDPGRPRRLYGNYTETTANDHERPTTRVVSDRIEFYPDDPKRPRDDRKRQKRLYGNIRDDPKRADRPKTGPQCISAPSVQLEKFVFKMAASEGEIDAALFMEECQKIRLLIQ